MFANADLALTCYLEGTLRAGKELTAKTHAVPAVELVSKE
jgi:hypothetical protein